MGFFFDLVTQWTQGRNLDTSDEALDDAAGFQQGFQEYLPLYNDYTGSSLSLQEDIQRPYDELREIDFRRLSEVAEHSAAIADEFQETREEINTRVAGVTGWSGDAANAFQAYIQRFQTAAQTVDGELGEIASATGEAVPAAQAIIAEYVDTIGEIDFSGFDSPEVIRILITIERMAMSVSELVDRLYDGIGDLIGMALPVFSSGGGGLFGSIPVVGQVVDAASDLVGDFIGGVLDFFGGADDLLALASRLARSYLDASFKRPFEDNLDLLTSAVETAKQGITEAFQPMLDAAGAVTLEEFTALGDAPITGPQLPSPTPGPAPQPAPGPTPGPAPEPAPGPVPGPAPGPVPGPAPGPAPQPAPVPAPVPGPGAGGSVPETDAGTSGSPSTAVGGAQTTGAQTTLPSTEPIQPEPFPRPEPLPVDSGAGGGPGGRPDDLPPGAGWIADPSQLPPGWTVDPQTGELLPPGASGGLGDPQVHSPQGQAVLDGPGPGEVTPVPAAGAIPSAASEVSMPPGGVQGAAPEVSMRLGDQTIAFSDAGGSGAAVGVTLTGADGASTRYEITIDESGNPQLVPATTVPAADGFASGSVTGGTGSGFAAGAVGGVSGALGGEVSTGDAGHAAASQSGHVASGWVPLMGDSATESADQPAEGSARLASVSMASDSGTVNAPGEAQLASAAGETHAAQQGGGGAPLTPMGGATGGGGDQERHGGMWQVPGADDVFEPDEPVSARGVLGDDR